MSNQAGRPSNLAQQLWTPGRFQADHPEHAELPIEVGPTPRYPDDSSNLWASKYNELVLSSAAIYHWPMDEAATLGVTQAKDIGVLFVGFSAGSPATIVNNPQRGVRDPGPYATRPSVGGYRFVSASSQYLSCGTLGSWGSTRSTSAVSFWVRTTTTAQNHFMGTSDNGSGNDDEFRIHANTNHAGSSSPGSTLFANKTTANLTNKCEINKNIYDGQWHFIAAVHSVATWTIYVDGQVVPKVNESFGDPGGGYGDFTNPLVIGAWFAGIFGLLNYIDADIASVAIYNQSLTAAQVAAIYQLAAGTKKPSRARSTAIARGSVI